MNEELKIIIKAITDEAKKNIEQVRKELENTGKSGKETGNKLSATMKTIGKSVAMVVGTITALTAAMAALGKRAQEISKGFEKLYTSFQSGGGSVKEAKTAYKELFGILGEHDKTIETAQSLSRITTEAGKLAEYYDILAGAVAKYGEGLQSEAFSEQISETIASSKAMGDLARVLVEAGISEDAFNAKLETMASLDEREVYVRSTLNNILGVSGKLYRDNNQATEQLNLSQANLNIALADAARYTAPLLTALNNLSATFLSVFAPALRTISLYLTAFIQLLAEAIAWVGNFFGVFGSKAQKTTADVNGYNSAMKKYTDSLNKGFSANGKGIDSNINKLKELKKQTQGFDELNVMSSPIDTSTTGANGGSSGGNIPTLPSPTDFGIGSMDIDFTQFQADLDEAKEKLKGILTLVGLIAVGFLAWKLTTIMPSLIEAGKMLIQFKGNLANIKAYEEIVGGSTSALIDKFKQVGGYIAIAAGAMLLLKGYTDAWANGVDWGNIALMIGGAALAITGLYLAISPLAASIGVVVAGIALMVAGCKDFIETGPTLQNTILIIGGAIAVAVGLATAGLSVLVSAIVAAVAAVAAFTASILLQKPAIMSVDEAQQKHEETINNLISAENNYVNVMDKADSALKKLQEAEKAAGMTGEELYNQVYNGTLTYADMNEKQKELYKAYLANETAQQELKVATEELTTAKKAETIASFENQLALAKESGSYDEYKKAVIEAFEKGQLSADEARTLIEKSMSEMSTASQQTFMEDIPNDIKEGLNPNKYETVKKKMGDWWETIKTAAVNTAKGLAKDFVEAIKSIPDKAKSGLNGLITVVEKAINFIVKQLNKIRFTLPDWDILGSLAGKSFGININPVSIPRLAKGGIVNSATYAMIGEQGKEAVLPLENNTEWMSKLADRLAAQINTPSKIVLTLDGKELGWANINSINSITKQTGALQLRMV